MNMLVNSLPNSLNIAGREFKINTDYRIWIKFETLLRKESQKTDEKIFQEILDLIFRDDIPQEQYYAETTEQIMWFYRCGKSRKKVPGVGTKEDVFSYEYDDGYISAAFKQQYGTNLSRDKLHWWEFHSYLLALSENTEFVKIMGIRAMTIDPKLPASQKSYYQKMKQIYKLPVPRQVEEQTRRLEEALINGKPIDELL